MLGIKDRATKLAEVEANSRDERGSTYSTRIGIVKN
jgi:hypothetical protein